MCEREERERKKGELRGRKLGKGKMKSEIGSAQKFPFSAEASASCRDSEWKGFSKLRASLEPGHLLAPLS